MLLLLPLGLVVFVLPFLLFYSLVVIVFLIKSIKTGLRLPNKLYASGIEQEKEELVIKLYQDSKSIREIVRQAHLSFYHSTLAYLTIMHLFRNTNRL
jgi:hypothetical protein